MIAGTATAVSNNVSRRQGQRWANQAAEQQPQQQQVYAQPAPVVYAQPAPVAPAAPAPEPVDRIALLKQLAELKDQGILTEAEFTAEKTKILAS
jgi:Short C-terminal domain